MLSLISLDVNSSEIGTLDGIQFAQNLETLIISANALQGGELTALVFVGSIPTISANTDAYFS